MHDTESDLGCTGVVGSGLQILAGPGDPVPEEYTTAYLQLLL